MPNRFRGHLLDNFTHLAYQARMLFLTTQRAYFASLFDFDKCSQLFNV